MFDVEVEGLTNARGQAAAEECADRNAWPITFIPGREEKRWFGIKKSYPAVLELATDSGGSPLAPNVERDADHIAMYAGAADRIATTVRVISDHFPEGFVFRATWAGSPIQHDETLSINELAEKIRDCELNEFTRYTVPPLTEIGGG